MRRLAIAAALVGLVALVGASAPPARAAGLMTMPFSDPLGTTIDGRINASAGEYPATGYYRDSKTGIEVYSVQDYTDMSVAIVSPGTGWLAIGFGPQGVPMDGLNILIGYVIGTTVVLDDAVGVGYDHKADTTLGCRDDLLAFAGSESGGRTTIEFRFPLDSGDACDVRLQPGRTYGVTLAFHESADDLVTMHTLASMGSVYIEPDPSRVPTKHPSMSLASDGTPAEGGNVTLVAAILGETGSPLAPAQIEFYVNTSVGLGMLEAVDVDADGRATLNYTFRSPGEFEFRVRFAGDVEYLPAEANLTLVAAARDGVPIPFVDLAVRAVVLAVLGVVGAAYLYSMGQVFRIRRIGTRAVRAARQRRSAETEGEPKEGAGPSSKGRPPVG